ncbi:MAG: superoxide dismutase family protein [Acidobacteriota bacterium]|nr:superoxide dismutase family protein [Acidobacteriota bacterium]
MIVFATACGGGEETSDEPAAAEEASGIREIDVMLAPLGDNEANGTASFTTNDDGTISVYISLSNVPEGLHAVHIHETGDCSSPDGKSAGGHWNPTTMDHGRWGTPPHHLGDLGNAEVDEFGSGALTVTTSSPGFWSIGTGEINDIMGKAIIVHAGVDDFATQPTGGAGGRIACGVIGG